MSNNIQKNIINDNNLAIHNADININKSKKTSLKNIKCDESRNNTIQSEDFSKNNLPLIMQQKETENEEKENYFYSESNTTNNENKLTKIVDERKKNVIKKM